MHVFSMRWHASIYDVHLHRLCAIFSNSPLFSRLSLEQVDHIFYDKGTKTNSLYQGVRESIRQRPAALVAPDAESSEGVVRCEKKENEEVREEHVENSTK